MNGKDTKLTVEDITFYTIDANGNCTPVWKIEGTSFVVDIECVEPKSSLTFKPEEIGYTLRIDYPKNLRCKTRKRFVKLIMSLGNQRNTANIIANDVMISDTTYEQFWRNLCVEGVNYLARFKIHKNDLLPKYKITVLVND